MTVLPGSLDYLYHNGILDRIPYEAYEGVTTPVAKNVALNNSFNSESSTTENIDNLVRNSGVNISKMYNSKGVLQYENGSQRLGYDSIETEFKNDSFEKSSELLNNSNQINIQEVSEADSFRKSIVNEDKNTNPRNPEKSLYLKGLIGVAVVLGTFVCLIRGKKPSGVANTTINTTGFLSKLNPLKWFKK